MKKITFLSLFNTLDFCLCIFIGRRFHSESMKLPDGKFKSLTVPFQHWSQATMRLSVSFYFGKLFFMMFTETWTKLLPWSVVNLWQKSRERHSQGCYTERKDLRIRMIFFFFLFVFHPPKPPGETPAFPLLIFLQINHWLWQDE